MHKANSIVINASRDRIFEVAADLSRWPEILPHYRYIEYLEKGDDRNVVKMAAVRDGIPIAWVSEQIIDRETPQIIFRHLRAWTKGMEVVWRFSGDPAGPVGVEIVHDLKFRIPLL